MKTIKGITRSPRGEHAAEISEGDTIRAEWLGGTITGTLDAVDEDIDGTWIAVRGRWIRVTSRWSVEKV